MYKRLFPAAALLIGGFSALAGRGPSATDTALVSAAENWDQGDYIAALTTYQHLLAGPDAARVLEPIALQTGELFRVTELSRDGANPVFAPDGRLFSFETGPGVAAGVASGAGRVTHVRAVSSPANDVTTLDGGDASLCPDGRRVAFLRVQPSAEISRAQESLAAAASAADRAPRQATLARLVARTGRVIVRDVTSGRDEEIQTGELLKTGLTCAADGAVLFAAATEGDIAATQIYLARAGSAPQPLTQGDGFKVPSKIDKGGRTLLYNVPRQGPFRQPAAGGGRGGGAPPAADPAVAVDAAAAGPGPAGGGGGGGLGAGATSFGVLTIDGKPTVVNGLAPALSRDGRFVAWLTRTGAPAAGGEQRLLVAAVGNLAAPAELRKGPERLDAPALSPDGSRVAFQVMPSDDWEIHLVGRDGKDETRVTREIQHDVLPQFLTNDWLLGMIGEARHRRSYLYRMHDGSRTKLFHNNSVRTIAPEYVWVASPDGTHLLTVAERDGDTVSPARGVYLSDLAAMVSIEEVRARVAAQLESERALRDNGRRTFAPIAADVRKVTSLASAARAYAHEKALFDFDSKHVSKPGNKLAYEYLFNAYTSFGYAPEYQYFSPRQAAGNQTANVVATLTGTVNPEIVYVVSSHYDSVAIGPGADDDTSGTAALLETARIMAGHPMPATIVFASFTGEEAGLLGSREFVRRAVEGKVRIAGALNNDMIGWANDHRLDNTIRYSNPGIRDIQHGAAIGFTNMITYDALYYKSTDAAAYYEAYGDIVGGIGSYPVLGNPHYHQSHDLLEGINHQLVAEVAKTTAATLMLLASSPARIADLRASTGAAGASVTWTPSPEKGITGYIVTWGPAGNPSLHSLRVAQPKAALAGAIAGSAVQVKAVNAKGLEGWDWARTVVK
ncbi:MAG: M20/M25/M40 family metallo-hydrolase [Vicinamibacterales bacterium]